ncbi:hypothetical protein [Flavobacterium croceum]|nr:hypothetical protein [Flavobacterium croceum]
MNHTVSNSFYKNILQVLFSFDLEHNHADFFTFNASYYIPLHLDNQRVLAYKVLPVALSDSEPNLVFFEDFKFQNFDLYVHDKIAFFSLLHQVKVLYKSKVYKLLDKPVYFCCDTHSQNPVLYSLFDS